VPFIIIFSLHLFHQFLKYIHGKRAQTGVAKMLLRLYSPFLWRSLKVAHPHVRANAACLMLDAFPLQDPDATRETTNTLLQKQFDAMMVRGRQNWRARGVDVDINLIRGSLVEGELTLEMINRRICT